MSKAAWVKLTAWGSAAIGFCLSIYVWGYLLDWQFGAITWHDWFPLFGLLAYSLMISHYLTSLVRQVAKQPADPIDWYFKLTSWVVLACLLLHPGLLTYKLWAEGHGLPLGSYHYHVGTNLLVWIYLGLVCWLAFMLYELHYKFEDRSWWRYVSYISDAAMIGIFFHAIKLGQHLYLPWFRWVWYGYGLILTLSLGNKFWQQLKSTQHNSPSSTYLGQPRR